MAVRAVNNAASVRTNTCPGTQETTPVGMACHDPIRGEFGSTMRSLLEHIDEIRRVLLSTPFDIFAINESKIDESYPIMR